MSYPKPFLPTMETSNKFRPASYLGKNNLGGDILYSDPMVDYNDMDVAAQLNYGIYRDNKINYLENQNSWQNQYLKPFTQGIQALGSIGNLYLGFQQLGIAKQQLGMAKEQWAVTKDEMNRIRKVRENITKSYMG